MPSDEDGEILTELCELVDKQEWYDDQLLALNEMRVLYMFKNLEISIKSLIKTAYPGNPPQLWTKQALVT